MPLGVTTYNGRPFGLGVLAAAEREDLLFHFMSAFEANFPARQLPTSLLQARKEYLVQKQKGDTDLPAQL